MSFKVHAVHEKSSITSGPVGTIPLLSRSDIANMSLASLKGTATLVISMFYMKELFEPLILIQVSSKSVEKYGSYGHLNICKWTLMEAAIF